MIYLNEKLSSAMASEDAFAFFEKKQGRVYRELEGRTTKRIEIEGSAYFVKLHHGVGWAEIFKNLLQLRAPVISAGNEWRALDRLRTLGVDTMNVVGFGSKGVNPARIHSFVITEELPDTVSLEEFCGDWENNKPPVKLKWKLIEKVADISRTMHGSGICHRDFYICHFLLHRSSISADAGREPRLSLIDLHRALVKRKLGRRWIEKDLAGIYFSSMDIGLTERDRLRFVRHYASHDLRSSIIQERAFWKRVTTKARALYKKVNEKR
ncbi:MAG: lipopolysaccharide core heptose(I) kinase RfaP [Pseudohongiellaceae bacterium]